MTKPLTPSLHPPSPLPIATHPPMNATAAYVAASAVAAPSAPPELAVAIFAAAAAQAKVNAQALQSAAEVSAPLAKSQAAPAGRVSPSLWARICIAARDIFSGPTLCYGLPAMAVAMIGVKVAIVDGPKTSPVLDSAPAVQSETLYARATPAPSTLGVSNNDEKTEASARGTNPPAAMPPTARSSKATIDETAKRSDSILETRQALPNPQAKTPAVSAVTESKPSAFPSAEVAAVKNESIAKEIPAQPVQASVVAPRVMADAPPPAAAPRIAAPAALVLSKPLLKETPAANADTKKATPQTPIATPSALDQQLLALINDSQGRCQAAPSAATVRRLVELGANPNFDAQLFANYGTVLRRAELCGFVELLPILKPS